MKGIQLIDGLNFTPSIKRWTTWKLEMTQTIILSLVLLMVTTCSAQKSPEQLFWRWFQSNELRLFDFEKDQDRVFDELRTQLDRVRPGLMFEFGPKEGGTRDFVISADGIKDVFPAVIALADAAPALPRWKIIKFRPRRSQTPMTLDGLKISPEQIEFTIEVQGAKAGITLFIEGYEETEQERYAGVVFLMLDQSLGEYDVETKVGFLEFKSRSAKSKLTKQPFSALPQSFDSFLRSDSRK